MNNIGKGLAACIVLFFLDIVILKALFTPANTLEQYKPLPPVVTPRTQATPTPSPAPSPFLARNTRIHTVSTSTPAPSAKSNEPYVGMHVSSVPYNWTWQGTDNLTVKGPGGNKVQTTKYRYDAPPKSYTIWVKENGDVAKVSMSDPTATYKPKKSTSKRSSSLDTSGYVHPEDFYNWNMDDFDDYEEAEDYYYSHGGR